MFCALCSVLFPERTAILSHPPDTVMGMSDVLVFPSTTNTCAHETFTWRDLTLSVCPVESSTEWSELGDTIDGTEAMAILFGNFDLVGALRSIGSPGGTVLVYSPDRSGRSRLGAFPQNRWLEGSPGLWFSHDGNHLLLSPSDPRIADDLIR